MFLSVTGTYVSTSGGTQNTCMFSDTFPPAYCAPITASAKIKHNNLITLSSVNIRYGLAIQDHLELDFHADSHCSCYRGRRCALRHGDPVRVLRSLPLALVVARL